jgi:membrane dipeptidase
VTPDALRLHHEAIVVDGHADTIARFLDDGEDLGRETRRGHLDLPRMFRGGLDAQFMSCWVEPRWIEKGQAARRAFRMIDAVKRWIAAHPDRIVLARSAADVRRAAAEGKVSGILCIEGGHAIEDDLALLRTFHEIGVRYLTLTWNNTNNWADSCREPGRHNGLSAFGREVVREMNRLGMLVDLSHVSEKTFHDALETSDTPVVCSHSCARALCDHPRNLTDGQLRALARNGGVAGVNFYPGFLSQDFTDAKRANDREEEAARRAARERHAGDPEALDRAFREITRRSDAFEASLPAPPLDLLVRHIEHMAGVAGVDHVGLGSDFDGIPVLPEEMDDCSCLPRLTERLLGRGWPAADVKKVLGENFLRVMERSIDGRVQRAS